MDRQIDGYIDNLLACAWQPLAKLRTRTVYTKGKTKNQIVKNFMRNKKYSIKYTTQYKSLLLIQLHCFCAISFITKIKHSALPKVLLGGMS